MGMLIIKKIKHLCLIQLIHAGAVYNKSWSKNMSSTLDNIHWTVQSFRRMISMRFKVIVSVCVNLGKPYKM